MAAEIVDAYVPRERAQLARIAFLTHRELELAGEDELAHVEFQRYWHLKSTIGDSPCVVVVYQDGTQQDTGLQSGSSWIVLPFCLRHLPRADGGFSYYDEKCRDPYLPAGRQAKLSSEGDPVGQ